LREKPLRDERFPGLETVPAKRRNGACTSAGPETLTVRTGSEISPRANAAASFSPETMSRATGERFPRPVGVPEAFDDLADFLFFGIMKTQRCFP
jgi:hypothetical protein